MPNKQLGMLPESIVKTSLTLGLFALFAALLLGPVNLVTADRILEQQLAAERRALNEVLSPSLHDNDLLSNSINLNPASSTQTLDLLDALQITTERKIYIARMNGEMTGVILPVEVHDGYSGDILLVVGILVDSTISGVRVLEHSETPGLGDKIDINVADWIVGFDGNSLVNPPQQRWQVVKDGGDYDQLVGATITTRSVVNGVRRALQFFQINKRRFANREITADN